MALKSLEIIEIKYASELEMLPATIVDLLSQKKKSEVVLLENKYFLFNLIKVKRSDLKDNESVYSNYSFCVNVTSGFFAAFVKHRNTSASYAIRAICHPFFATPTVYILWFIRKPFVLNSGRVA